MELRAYKLFLDKLLKQHNCVVTQKLDTVVRRYMIKATTLSGPAARDKFLECVQMQVFVPSYFYFLCLSFICRGLSCLSDILQRLSTPVVAMQGKTSRRWQIHRVDKCREKAAVRSSDGTNAAAVIVGSWYKPGTLGWTTMPDTHNLKSGTCCKGIGLASGKKGGL